MKKPRITYLVLTIVITVTLLVVIFALLSPISLKPTIISKDAHRGNKNTEKQIEEQIDPTSEIISNDSGDVKGAEANIPKDDKPTGGNDVKTYVFVTEKGSGGGSKK